MGNRIRLHAGPTRGEDDLKMSNGATSLFICALALAGSRLARTERQQELVLWLAWCDQTVVGDGTVGFSLSELPWTREAFAEERRFLLTVVAAAQERTLWAGLDYEPRPALHNNLRRFGELLAAFEARWVDPAASAAWRAYLAVPDGLLAAGFPRSPRRGVLLH